MIAKGIPQTVLTLAEGDRRLVLTVLGRQFPDLEPELDYEWLLVQLEVTQGKKRWLKVDPALTTQELDELRQWFCDLSNCVKPKSMWIGFIEPLLCFKVLEYSRTEIKLRVHIDYYDEYSDIPKEWYKDEKFLVNFSLNTASLIDAINIIE